MVNGPTANVSSTNDINNSVQSSYAQRTNGSTVVGGGWNSLGMVDSTITRSTPSGNDWFVTIVNHSSFLSGTMNAIALCATH